MPDHVEAREKAWEEFVEANPYPRGHRYRSRGDGGVTVRDQTREHAMTVLVGDALTMLSGLDSGSVQCCITSPPYFGLRDYGNEGQIGLEATPDEYVARLVGVFREVKRVLRGDGTLWLNLGDSYAGSWGNQGRKADRGEQRPINGEMLTPVLDGRFPDKQTNTGAIPAGAPYKAKDLLGIPWMVAFALRADGWYLRSEIIWAKRNPMPESVTDRPTKAHEQVFLLSKSPRYYYEADAIKEPAAESTVERAHLGKCEPSARQRDMQTKGIHGKSDSVRDYSRSDRNKRSVWSVSTTPFAGAHFATFPPKLIEPMVLAGCPRDGVILDPFAGSGTTLQVAVANGRRAVGVELNPEYARLIDRRLEGVTPSMFDVAAV